MKIKAWTEIQVKRSIEPIGQTNRVIQAGIRCAKPETGTPEAKKLYKS
ncbi:hypothetical protein [Egbenema bharatensis]